MLQEMFYVLISETIWFPNNATWNDFKYVPGDFVSNEGAILCSLIAAFVLVLLHFGLRKIWFVPLGNMLGIKNSAAEAIEDIPLLEEAYATHRNFSDEQIRGWSKQLDLNEIQVKQWMRLRTKIGKPGKLDRFCEYCFGLLFYSFFIPCAICVLWNSSWLWNIKECWNDYPNHVQSFSHCVYFIIKFGFCCLQFVEVKRNNIWMLVHHCITVALALFFWITRLHRILSLIGIAHDAVGIPFLAWKIALYAGREKIANVCLGIVVVTWIVSRVVIFPFYLVKSMMMDWPGPRLISPGYYLLNGILLVLAASHIFLAALMVQRIAKNAKSGNINNTLGSEMSAMTN